MRDLDWIRKGLSKPGKTQLGLAAAIGRDPTVVSKIVAGKRRIKLDEMATIVAYLEEEPPLPARPVPAAFPAAFGARDLPVRGRAQGGPDGVLQFDTEEPPIDWTFRPPELLGVRDAFGLYVDGDSMATTGLRHGAIVHVHPFRRPRPGDFVVLVKRGGEAFIKRLVRVSETRIILAQTDPPKEFAIAKADLDGLYLVVSATFA